MMPPILNSLGPITDWLSSRQIGAFSVKYDEVSRASSAAKVRHCTLRGVVSIIDALAQGTVGAQHVFLHKLSRGTDMLNIGVSLLSSPLPHGLYGRKLMLWPLTQ